MTENLLAEAMQSRVRLHQLKQLKDGNGKYIVVQCQYGHHEFSKEGKVGQFSGWKHCDMN